MTLSAASLGTVTGAVRWTPADLSGLAAWYDASDAATVTLTSSKVSQWDDKSGNARNLTQSDSAKRPVVLTAEQNGLDALSFSSANMSASLGTAMTGSKFTFMAAIKSSSTWTQYARIFSGATSSGFDYDTTSGLAFHRPSFQSKVTVTFTSSSTNHASTSISVGSWQLLGCIIDGTAVTVHVDGGTTSQTAGSALNLNIQRMALGTEVYAGSECWCAPFGEVVITTSAPSTADRQRLEGYLAHKWGLTGNLASDHPYKSIRP